GVTKLWRLGLVRLGLARLWDGIHAGTGSERTVPEALILVLILSEALTLNSLRSALLLVELDCTLQGWLIRGHEKAAAIAAGIVNELPLVIVVLLVEFADRLVFAGAGHTNDCAASEGLRHCFWAVRA